jgi:toxin CptA
MTSAPAIGFEYRPSPGFRLVLAVVAALAVLAVLLSGLAWWMKLLLSVIVLVAASRSVRRMAQSPISAAGWGAEDSWTVHMTSHEDVPATLVSFRVLGVLVLLRLKTAEHGTHSLLLAPDNSDADIRRRLRMRLATVQAGEATARA